MQVSHSKKTILSQAGLPESQEKTGNMTKLLKTSDFVHFKL